MSDEVQKPMLRRQSRAVPSVIASFLFLALVPQILTQSEDSAQTMRPVIRGRHAAVSSMKAEATEVARRILDAGGNAFDAAVGGQAALAITDFSLNGVGSDAVLLVYNAREKKVYSINAEPRAPKLATIEWYQKNNGGKIPESDGLLSGGLPGVVDAWYILLDRWGTMTFAQVLQPAIDLAENGFPLSEYGASYIAEYEEDSQVSDHVKIYLAQRPAAEGRRDSQESRSRAHAEEAGRSRKGKSGKRPARSIASRSRSLLQRRHRTEIWQHFPRRMAACFATKILRTYTAKVETPVSVNYRGYQVYKNPSASQGPTELFALNLLEGYDLKALGHNSPDFLHTSGGREARHGRSRKISRRHGLHQDPLRRPALQRLCARTPQAHRSQKGFAESAPGIAREIHGGCSPSRPAGA